MFIKYNGNNVHAIPYLTYRQKTLRNRDTGKVKTVMKLDTNQSPQDIKWLRPGWNEFPKQVWDQNKDHPQIKKMLADGKIEIMAEKVTVLAGRKKITKVVGQDDAQISLADFDEKKALQIVKSTYDRDLLQRWDDEETRGKVRRALEKQIKPLLPSDDTDKEDDEDDAA